MRYYNVYAWRSPIAFRHKLGEDRVTMLKAETPAQAEKRVQSIDKSEGEKYTVYKAELTPMR